MSKFINIEILDLNEKKKDMRCHLTKQMVHFFLDNIIISQRLNVMFTTILRLTNPDVNLKIMHQMNNVDTYLIWRLLLLKLNLVCMHRTEGRMKNYTGMDSRVKYTYLKQ